MWNRRRFVSHTVAASLASRLPSLSAQSQQASAPADPPLLIDSHVHVWKHDPAYPFAQGATPPPEDAPPEALLSLMQANNVSRTVLIQVSHYRWDNAYLADVLKQYPRQFMGVCRVNPEDPAAPDHLARLTELQGFHGVRLSPTNTVSGDWIRGPLMPPLWRRCASLKVPMTILTPVTRLPDLIPLLDRNPDLTVVIDHMADSPLDQPDQLKLLLALAVYPKVFVKISHMWSLSKQPYPYADSAQQVKRLYETFGATRLMWGTDFPVCLPYLSYAKAVALFRDHLNFVTPADRLQILSKTVQAVWPFGL